MKVSVTMLRLYTHAAHVMELSSVFRWNAARCKARRYRPRCNKFVESKQLRVVTTGPRYSKREEGEQHKIEGPSEKVLLKSTELNQLRMEDDAKNVTLMGAGVNGLMGISKLLAGLQVNSAALVADAAHSLSDLVSDAVTLMTLKVSRLPPDSKHPFGYGRYESVGALCVSSILIATAGYTAMYSIDMLAPFWLEEDMYLDPKYDGMYLHSHAFAMAVAFGSILSKEFLYRKTIKIAKLQDSKVLEANAWHHRSDALSSVVVLVSLFGSSIGYQYLDGIGGLTVSFMILRAGGMIGWRSIEDLVDKYAENEELVSEIENVVASVALESKYEIRGCHSVRTRKLGPGDVAVDMSIIVDRRLTASGAHNAASRLSRTIETNVNGVKEVLVHVEFERHGPDISIMRPVPLIERDIHRVVAEQCGDVVTGISHVRIHYIQEQVTVELEIEIDDGYTVKEARDIGERVRKALIDSIKDVKRADVHLEL